MINFPTSKIELHQWANTILLAVVGFFGIQTYQIISGDHEKLAVHETRITVVENSNKDTREGLKFLTGRVDVLSDYYHNIECVKPKK